VSAGTWHRPGSRDKRRRVIFRDYVSWWLRPRFLRPGGKKQATLFAGPWVGEFGWELMQWQGFVRKLSHDYQRVIVSCRRGNEALYQDFASEFVLHDVRGEANCGSLLTVENPEELRRVSSLVPRDVDHLRPLGHQPPSRQEFRVFGQRRPELGSDIVIHPRKRAHGADRNWGAQQWERLLAKLADEGYRVTCIGLRRATEALEGEYRDLRDASLGETMDILASARLALGPSSGPMHLASLCRTPHLVWTDRVGYARGLRNRDRYQRVWNPHGTPATVIDEYGFEPPVERVVDETGRLLGRPSATPASTAH
jgi:hypothetical protein